MDKIERVARAICAARGKNPDGDSGTGALRTVRRGNLVTQDRDPIPNWRLSETDAKVFIAAQEALEMGDDT
ncbi:hypothetical protein [Phenylobacterium kunshanense]|uniref:Uncharacterized protein n=1 Tax=Phenylobacterium kunshanense TaxID=1445034 RepID=A0A328BI82_9CAUL|nr:hypothetical protein [Phenylobacterium kunshanense]RAK66365.1 hypothetical protein DJ019_08955 [Phenylobacterium kunshanense]